jgi:hypothetical protein
MFRIRKERVGHLHDSSEFMGHKSGQSYDGAHFILLCVLL